MRVGILTLPLWHNYGGILQAYALRQAVETLGHDAVLLDVRRSKQTRIHLELRRWKRWLRRHVRGSEAPWYPDQEELRLISRNTRAFVKGKIWPKTDHVAIGAVKQMVGRFDAIIVGSDQVWRREYMPDLPTYFLAFPGYSSIRISYAASLGVNDWRFSSDETKQFAQSLRGYRAVSVREASALSLLERQLGIHGTRVCDPTLLFDADHYRRLAGLSSCGKVESKRIFTYVLDSDFEQEEALVHLAAALGGESFNVMPKPFGPGFTSQASDYVFPPVEAWLEAFNVSGFVITDSFHGCVFSLIFNRPFIAVVNTERGKARFESLLERFGLSDRLFPTIFSVELSALRPIDWAEVNRILAEERRIGLDFLSSTLSPELDG